MPAFAARAHRRALTRALEACGRGDGVPELADALVGAFAAVTDVDGACFHVADPASGLPTSSVRRGAPPGDFERSLEYEYRRPDVATFAELARRRVPVAARSRETAGAPQCSARFREMLAPEGCVDELRAVFTDAFGIWATSRSSGAVASPRTIWSWPRVWCRGLPRPSVASAPPGRPRRVLTHDRP